MDNIQAMLSLLPPITASILAIAGFLAAVTQLITQFRSLKARLRPTTKYFVLISSQIIPIGMVTWYYMYWAVQYHSRFTEPFVFLLLVFEPVILITIYEMFWGVWLYPRLLSLEKQKIDARQPSDINSNESTTRS